jgi:acyl carrier protein
MPSAVDLRERLTQLFAEVMHIDAPSSDSDLFDTGVLDSLSFVELLSLLKNEFGLTTTAADIDPDNFSSIDRIATFIASRRQ